MYGVFREERLGGNLSRARGMIHWSFPIRCWNGGKKMKPAWDQLMKTFEGASQAEAVVELGNEAAPLSLKDQLWEICSRVHKLYERKHSEQPSESFTHRRNLSVRIFKIFDILSKLNQIAFCYVFLHYMYEPMKSYSKGGGSSRWRRLLSSSAFSSCRDFDWTHLNIWNARAARPRRSAIVSLYFFPLIQRFQTWAANNAD